MIYYYQTSVMVALSQFVAKITTEQMHRAGLWFSLLECVIGDILTYFFG